MQASDAQAAVGGLADRLARLGWVSELWVGGSLATGDHRPGVSDLDLAALVRGEVDTDREDELAAIHRSLDGGVGAGLRLGCAYVPASRVSDVGAAHPTWTHGSLVRRPWSPIARVEVARHGYAVFGRRPQVVLPAATADDVRSAARAELLGYWARTVRWPLFWLDTAIVDLALTSTARGRWAMREGSLLTKTQALDHVRAPGWLVAQVRARRAGEEVSSPRLRSGLVAWRDVRRTVAEARAGA